MMYHGFHFGGMHLIWWCMWIVLLVWIFSLYKKRPYHRGEREQPIDVLKCRLASGEITNEEYLEKKRILEEDQKNK